MFCVTVTSSLPAIIFLEKWEKEKSDEYRAGEGQLEFWMKNCGTHSHSLPLILRFAES